ncbi:MAG: ATP-binding protein [Haliangium ochraceum]
MSVASPWTRRASGLGFHIAREIVDAHQGKICVDSEVGGGATFTVTLPRQPLRRRALGLRRRFR